MTTEDTKQFEFILPEGSIKYSNRRSLLKRLEREEEAWKFLSEIDLNACGPRLKPLCQHTGVLNGLAHLSNLKQAIEGSENLTEHSGAVSRESDPYSRIPPWTDTPEGSAAIRMKDTGDVELALTILGGVILKRHSNFSAHQEIDRQAPGFSSVAISTANTALMYDLLSIKDTVNRRISSLITDAEDTVAATNAIIVEAMSDREQFAHHANEQLAAFSADTETSLGSLDKNVRRKARLFKRLTKAGVKDAEELRDRFLVQMRYRAPVKLWADRQTLHANNAKTSLEHFYIGAIGFCVLLAFFIWIAGPTIAEAFNPVGCVPDKPETCKGFSMRGLLLVAGTTLVASIGLWFLRFKMKVHLSERHLALDAQERKAFAETFLALKEDKAVSEAQEVTVLQSLFRPTQDGIIRDDNANIDATPAGLISRLLSQLNPKQ